MNKYKPPMYCSGNSTNILYFYKNLEKKDPLYRKYRFEKIYEQLLKETYPKKDFKLANEWLNKIKKNPNEWEYILALHGITIKINNKKADYPTEILIGAVFLNGKTILEVTENWQEIFSSHKIFEVFACTVRAAFAKNKK